MKWFQIRTKAGQSLGWILAATTALAAGAQSEVHGRGWKPLPPTAHIVVTVLKGFNGKPLPNAAVVFHAVRNGKNDGNLEVKTDEEGKAAIDVIEIGSHLTVQVIASGFATSATQMDVKAADETLEVKMLRPRAQVSIYQQNGDEKPAADKPGIQEPPAGLAPKPPAPTPASGQPIDPTKPTGVPAPMSTPPPGDDLQQMARLEIPAAPFPQEPTPVTPALQSPTINKDAAATVVTEQPKMTARPSATPLAAPMTSAAPSVKSLTTPVVTPPSVDPRRMASPSPVQDTASPLSVTAPTAKPLTTPQVVTAPAVTQRAGARPAPAGAPIDAAPLSVTQRSASRPSATPEAPTQFLPPPPVTSPDGATPAPVALPKNPPQTAPVPPPPAGLLG